MGMNSSVMIQMTAESLLNSPKKCALVELGLIEVRGEEASKFLQNLVTSDVRLIHPGQGQFSSWCDAKGRIQATFWLIPFDDALYLILPRTMVLGDRKSTRLNSSHIPLSRMPSSA